MVYHGYVKDGKVELDGQVRLPEGAAVDVTVRAQEDAEDIPTLYEQLEPFIGAVDGLPEDLSVNHDHYLYGTPKRQ